MLVSCPGWLARKRAWFAMVDLQVRGLVSTVDCLLTARQPGRRWGAGGSDGRVPRLGRQTPFARMLRTGRRPTLQVRRIRLVDGESREGSMAWLALSGARAAGRLGTAADNGRRASRACKPSLLHSAQRLSTCVAVGLPPERRCFWGSAGGGGCGGAVGVRPWASSSTGAVETGATRAIVRRAAEGGP